MKLHRDKFLALDSYAAIDLAFINGMCGESGRKKVEDLYLKKCVPSAKNLLSVDAAVRNSQSMVESSMLQCMGSSCQGSISAAHSMLCAIQKGLPPCVDSDSTDFLKKVFSGTQYFAVYTGEKLVYDDSGVLSKAGLTKQVLTGQDAVQALWKDVASKSAKDLTLAQMEPFVTFMNSGKTLTESCKKYLPVRVARRVNRPKQLQAPRSQQLRARNGRLPQQPLPKRRRLRSLCLLLTQSFQKCLNKKRP